MDVNILNVMPKKTEGLLLVRGDMAVENDFQLDAEVSAESVRSKWSEQCERLSAASFHSVCPNK